MHVSRIIRSVAKSFPNLDPDDAYQELSLCCWKTLTEEGFEYSESLNVPEEIEELLVTVCWRRCVDLYCRKARAQRRDTRRTERLGKRDRTIASPQASAHDALVMSEIMERAQSRWLYDEAGFVTALVVGDSELSLIQQDLIDANGGGSNPQWIFNRAMQSRFNMNERTYRRRRRAAEEVILASMGAL